MTTAIIIALILAGIVLMFIEFTLTPGVGVAGVLSLASLAGSCCYAFLRSGRTAGLITLAVVIVIAVVMTALILRGKTWKKFELHTSINSKVNGEGESLSPGTVGKAVTRLAPMGTAQFGGTVCEAKSETNAMIDAGTAIEVVCVEENRPVVRPVSSAVQPANKQQ